MDKTIRIPFSALKYILLQRTSLQKFYQIAQRLRMSYHPFFLLAEIIFRKKQIRRQYMSSIVEDYQDIRSCLPQKVNSILDIGCGVAGIDVLLHRHYREASHIRYYLVDRTEVSDRVFYGFEPEGAFCNSLKVAETVLVSNGIRSDGIFPLPVSSDYRFNAGEIDLVISLLSWGYHYPIPLYLENVPRSLKAGGVLIVDVRRDTGGVEKLAEKFSKLRIIYENEKKQRVLAVKG